MAYWQVAAGSTGRDYSSRFVRHGLAFVGGDWQCDAMAQVQPDDVVILKRGMGQIVAVGTVATRDGQHRGQGDKPWLRDFDGWDLAAWCNVDWHVPPSPVAVTGLTRATIQGVGRQHLIEAADRVLADHPVRLDYEPEPGPTQEVGEEHIVTHLVRLGLRPGDADELTQAMRRIRLLARFYLGRDWGLTKEHETRTFLVVPLLIALGWAEQRIQVELAVPGVGRADVACFRVPVTHVDQAGDCVMLIETKGLSQGLDYAPEQAHRYAEKFPSCQVVLVTNGYCYKAYKRATDGTFALQPSAYLNLMEPRTRYPIDPVNVGGALDVLEMLLPR